MNRPASEADTAPLSSPSPLLRIEALVKRFGGTTIFSGVDLSLRAGELVALLGESGVGKSTLLHCIAGLEPADGGQVLLAGEDVLAMPEPAAARLRRERLGFVFQAFHVLPHLDVAQNVALPLRLLGRPPAMRDAAVAAMLEAVGLDGLGARSPRELSGGQLQRVAIARALVHAPALVLADEPTGNLDPRTAERILDLLVEAARRRGAGVLLVTHSPHAAARCDRVVELAVDGVREVTVAEAGS